MYSIGNLIERVPIAVLSDLKQKEQAHWQMLYLGLFFINALFLILNVKSWIEIKSYTNLGI